MASTARRPHDAYAKVSMPGPGILEDYHTFQYDLFAVPVPVITQAIYRSVTRDGELRAEFEVTVSLQVNGGSPAEEPYYLWAAAVVDTSFARGSTRPNTYYKGFAGPLQQFAYRDIDDAMLGMKAELDLWADTHKYVVEEWSDVAGMYLPVLRFSAN